MNQPIMVTPYELWTMVLALCAGIVAISGAVTVILKVIMKMKAPEVKQDERIAKCEERIGEINERFKTYDSYFANDLQRLDRLENGSAAENRALLALLNHAIYGNNVDELKDARSDLEKYLLSAKPVTGGTE